ncbi:MAG: hypothetical protein ABJF88_15165, partial [Rhodothermales bacterium]
MTSTPQATPSTSVPGGIRVVVVDDHPAIREAIADTVRAQHGMELCGLAGSAADAFDLVREADPDVAVI